jgi:hypothetical protein
LAKGPAVEFTAFSFCQQNTWLLAKLSHHERVSCWRRAFSRHLKCQQCFPSRNGLTLLGKPSPTWIYKRPFPVLAGCSAIAHRSASGDNMVKLNPTTPVHTLNLLELVDTAGAPAYVVAQANACSSGSGSCRCRRRRGSGSCRYVQQAMTSRAHMHAAAVDTYGAVGPGQRASKKASTVCLCRQPATVEQHARTVGR